MHEREEHIRGMRLAFSSVSFDKNGGNSITSIIIVKYNYTSKIMYNLYVL